MNISYDYYRIFYCVAKYGNLSQAAKVLMNNQPNLTRTIKNLESALGCPLFSRTNRGMKLTPEGKKLYAHVRIAFEHLEAGEAEIAESRNLETGAVSVAASEVALRCLLLPVLKRYRARYPGIRVRISNNSTPQAVAALKDGAADIAVVTTPTVESATLTERSIRPIHEKAVCTKAFPDLIGRPVTLAELADYVLVEADGAHGRPAKAHADYEPVVPPEANQTILVFGLSALGQPIRACVHRPAIFAARCGVSEDDLLTPELAATFINDETPHTRVLLNQADTAERLALGRGMAAMLRGPVCLGTVQKEWITC